MNRLFKDWLRGLAIVIISVLLIQLIANPISSFLNQVTGSPLLDWAELRYRLWFSLALLFVVLPIFVSKIYPRIALLFRKRKAKKGGWKPALVPTDDGKGWWQSLIMGQRTLTEKGGKPKILHSVLRFTSPTPFTGLPGFYEAQDIIIITNISTGEWMGDNVSYYASERLEALDWQRYDEYLAEHNQKAPPK